MLSSRNTKSPAIYPQDVWIFSYTSPLCRNHRFVSRMTVSRCGRSVSSLRPDNGLQRLRLQIDPQSPASQSWAFVGQQQIESGVVVTDHLL